ncbi:MAG TPA: hypothetical protein VIH57_05840, partial [Bacteroidales bacterium]
RWMGPPPSDSCIKGGRYNKKGESVLYLSDSEQGVKDELQYHYGSDIKIVIQNYKIPTHQLKIADLTSYERTSLINAVMWHCELANHSGYCSIRFSQMIAEILEIQKFDGAKVFGVRGDGSKILYNNVFIFNPLDRWKDWVVGRPYLI